MPVISASLVRFVPIERSVREALIAFGAQADFWVEALSDVFCLHPLEIYTHNSLQLCSWKSQIKFAYFKKESHLQVLVLTYCSSPLPPSRRHNYHTESSLHESSFTSCFEICIGFPHQSIPGDITLFACVTKEFLVCSLVEKSFPRCVSAHEARCETMLWEDLGEQSGEWTVPTATRLLREVVMTTKQLQLS